MDFGLRLLVGPKAALRRYAERVREVRVYATVPGAGLLVLPLDDDVHDALHRAYGTGEWVSFAAQGWSPRLTSSDVAFAAAASTGSTLAWIELHDDGQAPFQAAAAFVDGELAMAPQVLGAAEPRPRALWPVNGALRLAGVAAGGARVDELTALGLNTFRTLADVAARAQRVPL